MDSTTITQTILIPLSPRIRLKESTLSKIESLIEGMQKASIKLVNYQQRFSEWSENFFKHHKVDPESEEEKLDAAIRLTDLIYNSIEPAFLDTKEEIWEDLLKKAMGILDTLVSDGNGARFLEEYELHELEKEHRQLKKVEEIFDQAEEDLYECANQMNEKLNFYDEEMRKHLLEALKTGELKELHISMEKTIEEVEKLFKESEKDIENMQKIEKNLEEREIFLKTNLDKAEEIVRNI